jgi:hypothetical protein
MIQKMNGPDYVVLKGSLENHRFFAKSHPTLPVEVAVVTLRGCAGK